MENDQNNGSKKKKEGFARRVGLELWDGAEIAYKNHLLQKESKRKSLQSLKPAAVKSSTSAATSKVAGKAGRELQEAGENTGGKVGLAATAIGAPLAALGIAGSKKSTTPKKKSISSKLATIGSGLVGAGIASTAASKFKLKPVKKFASLGAGASAGAFLGNKASNYNSTPKVDNYTSTVKTNRRVLNG